MVISHEEIINDKKLRVAYGEMNFWFWHQYHFGWKSKRFHKERAMSLQSDKNTFIEAFRASRKTSLVRSFVCRCIAYKKEPSIIVQSYEDSLSAEWVRECAKMLFKQSVIDDHGYLFPVEKQGELEKKSSSNFESTTGVKVASKSLGQTLRGANTFDAEEEMAARPTLLILDDIDVIKSVSSLAIINQNEKKILNETMGALDPLRRKVIFLGNTINEDGIVPRFRNRYKEAKSWNIFQQPLFDTKKCSFDNLIPEYNCRPEVFNDKVLQTILDDGKTQFNQNYLLIPSTMGNGIFVRSYFDYFLMSHFEEEESGLKKNDMKCGLFIDPAFSTNSSSDDAVCILLAEHVTSKRYYLIDGYADTSAPSKTIAAIIAMYNKAKLDGFTISFISVEIATISKKQTQFVKDLKEELIRHQINVPVILYDPKINKEVRIKDNLESVMSMQGLKFNKNMSDKTFIIKAETQFLEYPEGDHDDVIDTISQGVETFRKHLTLGQHRQKQKKLVRNPELGQMIEIYV